MTLCMHIFLTSLHVIYLQCHILQSVAFVVHCVLPPNTMFEIELMVYKFVFKDTMVNWILINLESSKEVVFPDSCQIRSPI